HVDNNSSDYLIWSTLTWPLMKEVSIYPIDPGVLDTLASISLLEDKLTGAWPVPEYTKRSQTERSWYGKTFNRSLENF
ncbi:MAG: hypothetical protein AABY47_01910, partial [Pseudomonadota bacterium]